MARTSSPMKSNWTLTKPGAVQLYQIKLNLPHTTAWCLLLERPGHQVKGTVTHLGLAKTRSRKFIRSSRTFPIHSAWCVLLERQGEQATGTVKTGVAHLNINKTRSRKFIPVFTFRPQVLARDVGHGKDPTQPERQSLFEHDVCHTYSPVVRVTLLI